MANFVFTTDLECLVNLDRVATATHRRERRHGLDTVLELRSAEGKNLGYIDAETDLERLTAPVIPAAPGTIATIVVADYYTAERPTENDIYGRTSADCRMAHLSKLGGANLHQ